jgi:hypothetical protein
LTTRDAAASGRDRPAWDYRIATGTSASIIYTEAFQMDEDQAPGGPRSDARRFCIREKRRRRADCSYPWWLLRKVGDERVSDGDRESDR